MKVKKFIASSMPEAMKQIRIELGSDAVILNSRQVQSGGFLGLFKKKNIEVIAVADKAAEGYQPSAVKQKQEIPPAASMHTKENFEAIKKGQSSSELLREIKDLKAMINKIYKTNNEAKQTLPAPIHTLNQILAEQGIDQEVCASIISKVKEKWDVTGAKATIHEAYLWLEDDLKSRISHIPFKGLSFNKKFINFVGPTGVGKTTTLAKIAAECVINNKKKAAFITTDTYRIAAIEQLKIYAKILNIPMEVCYSLEDFKKAAQVFNDYDVVFIDTAGRNFRNKQYVEELKSIIDFEREMETILVLALTAKQRDMEDICEQFSIMHIDKLVFTKADETSSYGAMYNLICKYNKDVAYMTNGQNVPDDIVPANPDIIVKTIIGVK